MIYDVLMSNKRFWIIFSIIILVAIFLRFYKLGQIPVSLYWDEVAILADAKSVAQTGMDMHGRAWYQVMYPSYGDYKLPVYIWLASLSVKLFGSSEWALRLPSALAGIGTVVVAGLLARRLLEFINDKTKYSREIQLLTMGVVAVAPWSVMFSRTAFEGHLAQFLVGSSILLIFTVKKKICPGAILLGALATYAYFSVRFVWPIVFICSYFLASSKKKELSSKKILINSLFIILSLLIYFISLMPMMRSDLYQASNQFRLSAQSVLNSQDYALLSNQYREMAGNGLIDRVIFHRHFLMLRELAKNYSDHLSLDYLFLSGDSNLRHGTGIFGLFPLLLVIPFLASFIYLSKKKSIPVLLLLMIWWIFALLPASVPETTPHALRSLNALIPLSIMIGFGVIYLLEKVGSQKPKSKSQKLEIESVLSVLIIMISALPFIYHYFTVYPKESAFDWQDGYKQLTQVILEDNSSVRTVWVDPFEDRFYLWLLVYGDYPASEIQSWEKNNWKLDGVDNIVFKPFDWGKLDTLDHKIMIVGDPDNLKTELESAPLQPKWSKEIQTADGEVPFEVLYFDPD